MPKTKRGGAREGAGRPNILDVKRITITLDRETLSILERVDRNRSAAIRQIAKFWNEINA